MQLGWPDYPWRMRSGRSDLEGGPYISILVSSSTWFNYVLDVPFLCLDRTLPIHRPQTINFSWKMHPRNLFSYVPSASFDRQTSWRTSSFWTSNFSSSAHLTKFSTAVQQVENSPDQHLFLPIPSRNSINKPPTPTDFGDDLGTPGFGDDLGTPGFKAKWGCQPGPLELLLGRNIRWQVYLKLLWTYLNLV